jgi:hypothetical protein
MNFNQVPTKQPQEVPEKLGTLSDGQNVFRYSYNHFHNESPELQVYISQALEKINPNNRTFFRESIDFGKTIGFTSLIETREGDEIIYAQREGRKGLSRFVKNRDSEPTSFLTVVLKQIPKGYKIITAYIGSSAEREPWDNFIENEEELLRCKAFWKKHALTFDNAKIIPGTEKSE